MRAYYNEIDPNAAAWLRELIKGGHIAPGDVDERSIADVDVADLRGYGQCHFFAGIGGWSYAARLARIPDDHPIWTGSCPCPPFSAAGKGSECPSCGGKRALSHPFVTAGWVCLDCGDEWRGDDRHLLPEFFRLIGQCRPARVFGEQVASKDGRTWFAGLRAAVERVGFAAGCADLCAAGIGAPHIRQRLIFGLADTSSERQHGVEDTARASGWDRLEDSGGNGWLADTHDAGPQGRRGMPERADQCAARPNGMDGRMAHAYGADPRAADIDWRDADWLFCRDGSWRPVEPGTFPLAHGVSARVGRLRGYGNAIVPKKCAIFIQSFEEAVQDVRAAA